MGRSIVIRSFPTRLSNAWEAARVPRATGGVRRRSPAPTLTGLVAIKLQPTAPLTKVAELGRAVEGDNRNGQVQSQKIKMEDLPARTTQSMDSSTRLRDHLGAHLALPLEAPLEYLSRI